MPRHIRALVLVPIFLLTACKALPQNQRLAELEALQHNDREIIAARMDSLENRMDAIRQDLNETRQSIGLLPRETGEASTPVVPYLPPPQRREDASAAYEEAPPAPAGEEYPMAAAPDFSGRLAAIGSDNASREPEPAAYPAPEADPAPAPQSAEEYAANAPPQLAPLPLDAPPPRREKKTEPARRGPKAAYDSALALYHQGQYAKAGEAFSSFLAAHPGSPLAPNALYWKGECLYSQGKFDQAILAFKDVASQHPKHDKAAAALLKAGYAYAELNDMGNARFYWQLLVDDFPASAPAALAKKRLDAVS